MVWCVCGLFASTVVLECCCRNLADRGAAGRATFNQITAGWGRRWTGPELCWLLRSGRSMSVVYVALWPCGGLPMRPRLRVPSAARRRHGGRMGCR